MARARGIKPGFYKNEDLAECSVWARFIFPGLWMLADREGRIEDRPKRIKAELLPFDAKDMEPLLRELASKCDERGVPFIIRYQNSDGRFIQISKFKEHQRPHYSEKASVIKGPTIQEFTSHDDTITPENSGNDPDDDTITPENSGNDPDDDTITPENSGNDPSGRGGRNAPCTSSLIPSSLIPSSLIPSSLIPDCGKERKRPARKRATHKTPVPEGFRVSERVRQWAEGKGFTQLEAHCEAFVSKCKAKAYTYADWDEGLMGAIRDDWAGLRNGRPNVEKANRAAVEEWLAQHGEDS